MSKNPHSPVKTQEKAFSVLPSATQFPLTISYLPFTFFGFLPSPFSLQHALSTYHLRFEPAGVYAVVMDFEKYRAKAKAKLSDWKTDDDGGLNREEAETKTKEMQTELAEWQDRLYAEGKQALLIVLQARDAGGKDGTVKKVIGAFNPNGVRIANFKVPSEEELAHDFLWRVHAQVPRKGMIGVFNRSHYEDVLVTRVHGLVDDKTAKRRLEDIRNFEELLTGTGTHILKFYLHISKEEQKERLQERLDEPSKNWKFNLGDLKERAKWDEYTEAYQDALGTSTEAAPWYVIPADRKWFRDHLISQIVLGTLKDMNPQYPKPTFELAEAKKLLSES